jgi:uncharacterized protein YkwD
VGDHRWGGGGRRSAILLATLLGVASLAACGGSELEVSSGPGAGEPPPAEPGEGASSFSPEPPPTGTPDTLPPSTTSSSSSTSSTSTTTPTDTTEPDEPGSGDDGTGSGGGGGAQAQAYGADVAAADQSVAFVNQKRAENGRGALTVDPELQAAAEEWARQMAVDQNMRHDPARGDKMPAHYSAWGENVAYGYSQPSIDQAWWESDGHQANILGRQYDAVGIAFVRDPDGTYWAVQIFGGG